MTLFIEAREFLEKMVIENNLNKNIIDKHLSTTSKFENLNDANHRLIKSLGNRQMMPNVIKFKEREREFNEILFNFDPWKILKKYPCEDKILEVFKKKFMINNADSKRSLWRTFSKGIISGSRFIGSFKDKKDFEKFVDSFKLNKYTRASLPMILDKEITGFGFALACDFLKELGYRDYPKPDVHLKKIFHDLNLVNNKEDYEVYKEIISMSESIGKDAYTIDKIFWLISSGDFYLDEIKITGKREEFIEQAKIKLNSKKDAKKYE